MLHFGLLVNPVAGLGGAVALKGSDGQLLQERARAAGGQARAPDRLKQLFDHAPALRTSVRWSTCSGVMGAKLLEALNVPHDVLHTVPQETQAMHTRAAAQQFQAAGVDLIVFCGGDGTARDLFDAVENRLPVLGIPSGVKMHSGVFATSPRAAGELLTRLISHEFVAVVPAEVRDVDESALRAGNVSSRYYGEVMIPTPGGYVQQTKIGGREDEALALEEIVQGFVSEYGDEDVPLLFGPGGTTASIAERMGARPTLLGFDYRDAEGQWRLDLDFAAIDALIDARPLVVLGIPREQGIVVGRGNQQLTPKFLGALQPQSQLLVVATRAKLGSLEGRALLVDTGSSDVDRYLAGLWQVYTGYEDRLLYEVAVA